MNRDDIQLLRHAALELQEDGDDLIRVAGVVQRIKNWWKAKFNKEFAQRQEKVEQAYDGMKGPLSELIGQLQEMDKAFKGQDSDTVAQLVGTVPGTIARVTRDMGKLSREMRAADAMVPVSYVDDKGQEVAAGTLDWTARGYTKNKELIHRMWELLPEEFRKIPIGQRINRPITEFSWFSHYSPNSITVSSKVYAETKGQFEAGLKKAGVADQIIDRVIQYGFDDFIDNLKTAIINDSTLVQVNFPGVSKDITRRPTNQMMVDVQPGYVSVPVGDSEILVHVGMVRLNDIGASLRPRSELAMVMVRTIAISNEAREKLKQAWRADQPGVIGEAEEVEPEVAEPDEGLAIAMDGPITKIVKRALVRNILPITQAVVKVSSKSFPHKTRFAKILSSALRQEIDAECSVRHRDNDVEVQVQIYGTKIASLPAIQGVSVYIAEKFSEATKTDISVEVRPGLSALGLMESSVLDESLRKVAFDCLGVL